MHVKLKKRFGQNFLIDKNILNKIFNLINQKNLDILEIGPGSGNLTEYILKTNPKKLTLIEIDKHLSKNLEIKFQNIDFIDIINIDFLEKNTILDKNFDIIISNLPYNISSQILIKLTKIQNRSKRMILMFQKEFADRLLERNLNSLNSFVKCFYKIEKKFEVSNKSFFPSPKVKSTILEFNLLNNFLINQKDIDSFIEFKRNIFNNKRKTIGSIIKRIYNIDVYKDYSLLRAENLSLNEFTNLYFKINP